MMVFELYILSNMVFLLGIHVCFGGGVFFHGSPNINMAGKWGDLPLITFQLLRGSWTLEIIHTNWQYFKYIKSSFWQPKQCESPTNNKKSTKPTSHFNHEVEGNLNPALFFLKPPSFLVGMFQICFIFTPIWGRFPIWLIFFRWVGSTTNQIAPKNDGLEHFISFQWTFQRPPQMVC